MDFSKEYFKIRSGGLPKNGKPKDSQVREGFRRTKTQRFTFGVSGGLPKNGKTQRFTIGWASLFRRTEKTKIRKIGWASVFRRTGKFQDSIGWASDLREKRNQDSYLRILDRVGFRPSGKEEPRFDRVGFRPSGKEEPRFVSFELASDLRKKWNQDSSQVSRVSSKERKKPKIRKFGWIAKERSKIHIYEYMNHVIVELYLN
ncbi:unnamed protein product [Rhizophagus irregularis]|nr:unnamed protein product [Rhizophagus irregularis]